MIYLSQCANRRNNARSYKSDLFVSDHDVRDPIDDRPRAGRGHLYSFSEASTASKERKHFLRVVFNDSNTVIKVRIYFTTYIV